ncbi:alpha/beta fold hydrolase [Nonomuraea gerenzanensis]|uniref:alpha/beta fold hydrolase n=1 Tax=Nonomuraea gerenzanensis TaxID=93944 RepID=UPI001CD9BAD4|nr:alpha/beta fold hydrolase [Nonomuraea gerenzanensis]UBU09011.1 alpha/beta hydrolase [Nonomuraea gerenzanensis]
MKRWTKVRLGVLSCALVSAALPGTAVADEASPAVEWKACPSYSDAAITAMGYPQEKTAAFRALLKRLECGTVSVPLHYGDPDGRQITIAVTRLAATDQEHRLGALAVAPGGPGQPGYLDPLRVTLTNTDSARLNERFDLIGFDPRGVNYSTKVDCAGSGQLGGSAGPLTKAAAKRSYDAEAAGNRACGQSDPAFLGQLTTVNVARDLDLVRTALDVPKLNLLGVSYGTWLGAVYRSLFPARTGRVLLDSPASPGDSLAAHEEARVRATERNFPRFAAWLARHHQTFGLGTTARQVRATVLKLGRDHDRHPRTFTDLRTPIDGGSIAALAAKTSREWPQAGKALAELRKATGTTAPPAVKQLFSPQQPAPVPGATEWVNMTMNRAVKCNEDHSRLSFPAAWAAYQKLLKDNPVTGRASFFGAGCAGWPLPAQTTRLRHGGGPLILAAHRYEFMSPYEYAAQMQAEIGGRIYTIDDDAHSSALRACTADLVAYFTTGRIDRGCPGAEVP